MKSLTTFVTLFVAIGYIGLVNSAFWSSKKSGDSESEVVDYESEVVDYEILISEERPPAEQTEVMFTYLRTHLYFYRMN